MLSSDYRQAVFNFNFPTQGQKKLILKFFHHRECYLINMEQIYLMNLFSLKILDRFYGTYTELVYKLEVVLGSDYGRAAFNSSRR